MFYGVNFPRHELRIFFRHESVFVVDFMTRYDNNSSM